MFFRHIESTMQWWLMGRLIEMIFIGALTWLGLLIIGFPLALSLGRIAGFLNFIPYLGPILSAIPGVLIGLALGPRYALYALIVYTVVQSLEGYVLTPFIDRKMVWLPPALTIAAQVLFGFLFGALGVLPATPMTAVMTVLVKKLYLEGIYGEEVELSRADGWRARFRGTAIAINN